MSRASNIEAGETDIIVHKDFRLFVLANRPGYPFLGNDFFREAGDCFSTHIIENPDAASQFQMLKAFANTGNANQASIKKLIGAFDELRVLYDEGVLSYPYSVRELVNVVKHMDKFPSDGLSYAVDNVLSWDGLGTGNSAPASVMEEADSKDDIVDTAGVIRGVLLRHGINADDLRGTSEIPSSYAPKIIPFSIKSIPDQILPTTSVKVPCPSAFHELKSRNSAFKFGSIREVSAENINASQHMGSMGQRKWKIGILFDRTL